VQPTPPVDRAALRAPQDGSDAVSAEHVEFLRRQIARLRELAFRNKTEVSAQLIDIAAKLELRANDLNRITEFRRNT
jgi:hypothetical protein